ANDVNLFDTGNSTFSDIDFDLHLVARQIFNFNINTGTVATLRNVFALQRLTDTFEGCTLEDLSFGQIVTLQTVHQAFGLDDFVAFNLNGVDRRTLFDDQYQDVTVAPHGHI